MFEPARAPLASRPAGCTTGAVAPLSLNPPCGAAGHLRGPRREAPSPDEGHLSPAHDEAGSVAGHDALAPHRSGAAGNLSTPGGGMRRPDQIVRGPANSP